MTIHTPETKVRFILNGRPCEANADYATLTVLDFLRDIQGLRGTKEGCAEGDCGSCMIAFAAAGQSHFRAVNSCLKLTGTLNGGSLVTIEHLSRNAIVHPVSSTMARYLASQCGFCTPGFVMSLFTLYESGEDLTDDEIQYALAGNLCRCTGYRPILEAARELIRDSSGSRGVKSKLGLPIDPVGLHDIPPLNSDDFYAPQTIQALNQILTTRPDALLMAGGTDIIPRANKHYHLNQPLIYLGFIEELKAVNSSMTHLEIGSAAPLESVFPLFVTEYPELKECIRRFASLPIINTATLGGNLANASPVSDLIPVLIALDAVLVLRTGSVTRIVDLQNFYTDYRQHVLGKSEYIECIRIPRRRPCQCLGVYKISKRFEQDTATVLGAFSLQLMENNVQNVRISYAGMSKIPGRAAHVEASLEGQPWIDTNIEHAVEVLTKDYTPISDLRGSKDYRMAVAGNLLRKFFLETVSGRTINLRNNQCS